MSQYVFVMCLDCRFLNEPHGGTFQEMPFFIVTALETSNLTLSQTFTCRSYPGIYLYIYRYRCYRFLWDDINIKISISRNIPPDNCIQAVTRTKTNSVAFSPQANSTDWATATCWRNLAPTFVDRGVSRGQGGGSLTVANLTFLDRSRYFSFK
jgi:hypothetical protein